MWVSVPDIVDHKYAVQVVMNSLNDEPAYVSLCVRVLKL